MNTEVIRFTYNSQPLEGSGSPVYSGDRFYEHVLRVDVGSHPSLPSSVIVKIIGTGPNATFLFDNEKAMYDELKILQGTVLPVCYGTVMVDGKQALLLEDIEGDTMADDQMPAIEEAKLRPLLERPLRSIREIGVLLTDVSLMNMIFRDGSFVIVDLEFTELNEVDLELDEVQIQVDCLVDDYKQRQEAMGRSRHMFR